MKIPAWAFALMVVISMSSACGKKESTPSGTSGLKPFTPPDPTIAATVSGVINFSGAPPQARKIDMSQDPACGNRPTFDDSVIVENHRVANVFVFVKEGLSEFRFTPPSAAVTIEQKGCRYQPHVAAALNGQIVKFDNSDQTTHNVHMMPKQLPQWNESQMPSGPSIEKRFDRPEIMIPIQCNQHPWMRMYLNVVANPFYAITGSDGSFEIEGLPPGTYTVAAVHEKFGEQDMKVTVGPKETRKFDFVFKNTP